MRHPENVYDIPLGIDGHPLPPHTGHGVWKPDYDTRTDQGDVFLRLLNSPNVKSVVHMLTDHVEDVDNPYITEIHTYPWVRARANVRDENVRWSHMVLVLGRKVNRSDRGEGTISTD